MSTAGVQAKAGRALAPNPIPRPAMPPDRRLRASGDAETGRALVLEPVLKIVEDACRKALGLWPDAKAAILFGSRARGDHRRDSDWDIAFITGAEASLPGSVSCLFRELQDRTEIDVQAQAISWARFNEGANSLGNIAAPITREGRLIAGSCEWPEIESEPILKPNEYKQWRNGALKRAAVASERLAEAIEYAHRGKDPGEFGLFVAASSDAAEFCAKIAFGRLAFGTGAEIARRHQVNKIVEALDHVLERSAVPGASWWRSDRGKELRSLLLKMNGRGDEDHQAGYSEFTPSAAVIANAAHRLLASISFAISEVDELPDPGGLRETAGKAAPDRWTPLLASARRLRSALQDLGSDEPAFATANPVLAKSASVALGFGDEIAQALEALAADLYARMGSEGCAEVNPAIYVVGYGPDGKPAAIADDAEAIMDFADKVSNSLIPRMGAGLGLLNFVGFNQALSALGFALVPSPRILPESEAIKLVKSQKVLDPGEAALREVLAELLREREDANSPRDTKQ